MTTTEADVAARDKQLASHHLTNPASATLEDTPDMPDAATAINELIDTHFDGNATKALLAIAAHADIAVAWMDQRWIAREFRQLGVTLTAELWDKVRTMLGGFDAYSSDPRSSPHTDYLRHILRELGIKNDRGEDLDL